MEFTEGLAGEIRSSLDLVNGNADDQPHLNNSVGAIGYAHYDGCEDALIEATPDFQPTQNLADLLKQSVNALPQDRFIDYVLELSNGSTQAIQGAKDQLVDLVTDRPGCGNYKTIVRRKGTKESTETFNRRLAIDCYKLLLFLEGAPWTEAADVFRPPVGSVATSAAQKRQQQLQKAFSVSTYDVTKDKEENESGFGSSQSSQASGLSQSTSSPRPLDTDAIASLHSTVHCLVSRVDSMETTINNLQTALDNCKCGFQQKQTEARARNSEKEKRIRDDILGNREALKQNQNQIETIKSDILKGQSETEVVRQLAKQVDSDLTGRCEYALSQVSALNGVSKSNSRGITALQRDVQDIRQSITLLKEPKDSLLASLRSQVKTTKDRVKSLELQCQDTASCSAGTSRSVTTLREKIESVSKAQKSTEKFVRKIEQSVKCTENAVNNTGGINSRTLQQTDTRYTDAVRKSPAARLPSGSCTPPAVPEARDYNREWKLPAKENSPKHVQSPNISPAGRRPDGTAIGSDTPRTGYRPVEPQAGMGEGGGTAESRASPHASDQANTDTATKGACMETTTACGSEFIPVRVSHRPSIQSHDFPRQPEGHTALKASERSRQKDDTVHFYMGNIQDTTTGESIRHFLLKNGITPVSVKVLRSKKQFVGNGAKISLHGKEKDKLLGLTFPMGIYVRAWYERERSPNAHVYSRTFYGRSQK